MTSREPTEDSTPSAQPPPGAMTTKEKLDTLISFLQTLVSWPVMLLVVLFLIRDQIPDMAGRIESIGPGGIELSERVQQLEATQVVLEQDVEQIRRDLEFRPSSALSPELEAMLRARLDEYRGYLETVGFNMQGEPVEILITSEVGDNAHYIAAENLIKIGPALALDPEVAMYEYTVHSLSLMVRNGEATGSGDLFMGIERGLADYFTCSFSGDPRLGEIYRPPLGIRNLENEMTVADIPSDQQQNSFFTRDVWNGAFWELRSLLEPERADRSLLAAWSETGPTIDSPSTFVEQIVSAAANEGGPVKSAEIRELFADRGLLAVVEATPAA